MRAPSRILLSAVFWTGVASTIAAAGAQIRRSQCRSDEFMCDNKQRCIHEFDKCDGKKDCADGSDETLGLCWIFGRSCSSNPFSFKCSYGACIDKSKACDGNEYDCADNSDELNCPKLNDTPDKTSRCQSGEFTCASGDCISLIDVCDGIANCADSSDENIAQCAGMSCPYFSFQCAYGACVDGDTRCNGKIDCVDKSDEAQELCNRDSDDKTINKADEANSTTETCPFPSHENTKYRLGCPKPTALECQLTAGMPVKKNALVVPSCPPGYALPYRYTNKFAYMVCTSPPNFSTMITCEKMCSPLVSGFHDLVCKLKGKLVPCDRPMYPETRVHLKCKEHFKPQNDVLAVTETRCQADGTWDYKIYKCIPECGRRTTIAAHEKVAYGTTVLPGEAPWYAGMWRSKNGTYEHFCGGTVIAPHLMISAAHCFTEFTGISKTDDIANIQVAVAKFNSKWEARGEHEQRVGIKVVYERRGYIGPPGFEKDLAVVEFLQSLSFNNYTLPACVDWQKQGTFSTRTQGYIVGFGRNENNVPSETLQAASLSYIPPRECNRLVRASTHGSKQGIMWDQFCAGSDVGSEEGSNPSYVQRGDSGGGYTFVRSSKYYLYGVLSHHLENVNSYAVYTNISEHIDWMKENFFHETLV